MNEIVEFFKQFFTNLYNAFKQSKIPPLKYPPPYMLKRQNHIENIGPFGLFKDARDFVNKMKQTDPCWDYEPVNLYMWKEYPNQINLEKNLIPREVWSVEEI